MEDEGEGQGGRPEIPPLLRLTWEQFASLDPGGSSRRLLDEMEETDEVFLVHTETKEERQLVYTALVVLREATDEALVNILWVEDDQYRAILHCLERVEVFTEVAYATLGQKMPGDFGERKERLEKALVDRRFLTPEVFLELDGELTSLEMIVVMMEEDEELRQKVTGFDELYASIDLARKNFDHVKDLLGVDEPQLKVDGGPTGDPSA